MRSISISVGSIVFLSIACAPSPDTSNLNHALGKTSRQPKAVLQVCSVETPTNPTFQAAQRYIADIAQFIMSRNASAFSGVYAPEHFCFAVQADAAVNAFANPDQRKVTFFTGMLEAIANDGQVAAVMAHELAHITMQHVGVDDNEAIASDPRWQSSGPALKQNLLELAREQGELHQRQELLLDEQSSLEADLNARETAGTGAMRRKLDGTYEMLNNQINAILSRLSGDGDFTRLLGLSTMLLPPTPRLALDDGFMTQGGDATTTGYADLRDGIARYLSEREAWIAAEKQSAPGPWQTYLGLADRASALNKQFAALYAETEAINAKLDELRKTIAGEGARNLEEKEADDVALEFYLRAGLAPLNFLGMFDVLNVSDQQDAAACVLQNEANTPSRGDGSHPAACWRYYNAKVLEMNEHGTEYGALINKAVATEIVPGSLDKIKRALGQSSR